MVNPILDPSHALAQRLKLIESNAAGAATQPILLNASTGQIGGGTPGLTTGAIGEQFYNSAGVLVNFIQTSDGTMICFDNSGTPQARMGALLSSPGNYGLEIWTGVAWQQVIGATSVDWSVITGKPATFPATLPVATATNATNATNANVSASCTGGALTADGSPYAYNNNVPGTSFFAVWVGNDGSNHMGKNVSSIRYKTNVRAHTVNPAEVLKLQPVLFDRLPVMVPPPEGQQGPPNMVTGPSNEFGMIAEQVAEHLPEIVQWFDSEIDGIRFDLLPVAQQSVLIDHDGRIAALEAALDAALDRIAAMELQTQAPATRWSPTVTRPPAYTPQRWAPNVPAYAAPAKQPKPLPYTIRQDTP